MRILKYIKKLFRARWIYLKIPKEFPTKKKRIECIKKTRQQIIFLSKINN